MFYNLRELIYIKLKFATYTRNITKWNSIIASKGRIFKKNYNYRNQAKGQGSATLSHYQPDKQHFARF